MKKRSLYLILVMFFCMAMPMIAFADDDPIDPNDVPIDGGLTLLLAAGAAYGVKKYRDGKKKQGEEDLK